jgi:hypothetical protein
MSILEAKLERETIHINKLNGTAHGSKRTETPIETVHEGQRAGQIAA